MLAGNVRVNWSSALGMRCDNKASGAFTVSVANVVSQALKDALQKLACFIVCDFSIKCDVEWKWL